MRDDDLRIRVFQACRNQPSGERDWIVGVDPRRVMVERMGRRPPDPDELATAFDRLPRRGSDDGAAYMDKCPLTGGPDPDSRPAPAQCLTVLLPERDLPTVTRMLGGTLRDVGDACLPLTVELGRCVPATARSSRDGTVEVIGYIEAVAAEPPVSAARTSSSETRCNIPRRR